MDKTSAKTSAKTFAKKEKALKMAIEQMNVYAHIHLCEHQCQDEELLNVIQACKEALEQQEIGDAEIRQMINDIEYYQKRVEALEQPAPSWQGLSNDEIDAIVNYPWGDSRKFACAIEQALRNKNG